MRRILLILIFCPFCLRAQDGIHFEKDMTWQQVKEKAKKENKFIFVDCFTTWCGPCKSMDHNIYPNDTVGKLVNDRFVSVKVQLDTSKRDDENVKQWYADAHMIKEQYKIHAFPTFLFFSPDGEIVHRGQGYQD